jgi:hypothetical protein
MQTICALLMVVLGAVAGAVKCFEREPRFRVTRPGGFLICAMLALTAIDLWENGRKEQAALTREETERQERRAAERRAEEALTDLRATQLELGRNQEESHGLQLALQESQSELVRKQGELGLLQAELKVSQRELERVSEEALELTERLTESDEQRRAIEEHRNRLDEIQGEYLGWVTGTREFLKKMRDPGPVNPRMAGVTAPGLNPLAVYRIQTERLNGAWGRAKAALTELEAGGSFGAADREFERLLAAPPNPTADARRQPSTGSSGMVTLRDAEMRVGRPAGADVLRISESLAPPLIPPSTAEEWIEGIEEVLRTSEQALGNAVDAADIAHRKAVLGG